MLQNRLQMLQNKSLNNSKIPQTSEFGGRTKAALFDKVGTVVNFGRNSQRSKHFDLSFCSAQANHSSQKKNYILKK